MPDIWGQPIKSEGTHVSERERLNKSPSGGRMRVGSGVSEDFKHDWCTPPWIWRPLGPFDLDPCQADGSNVQHIAKNEFTLQDDGLRQKWFGFVWMNPPYHETVQPRFFEKMAFHNNGIALTLVNTDTEMWHRSIFPVASAYLFLKGRVNFYTPEGAESNNTAGLGSVLVAFGEEARTRLHNAWREARLLRGQPRSLRGTFMIGVA